MDIHMTQTLSWNGRRDFNLAIYGYITTVGHKFQSTLSVRGWHMIVFTHISLEKAIRISSPSTVYPH